MPPRQRIWLRILKKSRSATAFMEERNTINIHTERAQVWLLLTPYLILFQCHIGYRQQTESYTETSGGHALPYTTHTHASGRTRTFTRLKQMLHLFRKSHHPRLQGPTLSDTVSIYRRPRFTSNNGGGQSAAALNRRLSAIHQRSVLEDNGEKCAATLVYIKIINKSLL